MSKVSQQYSVLSAPDKPNHLPDSVQWLSGEGAGSWFHIVQGDAGVVIGRYSPDGVLECRGVFRQEVGADIDLNEYYEFTYLSHCAVVNIKQNDRICTFKLINKLI